MIELHLAFRRIFRSRWQTIFVVGSLGAALAIHGSLVTLATHELLLPPTGVTEPNQVSRMFVALGTEQTAPVLPTTSYSVFSVIDAMPGAATTAASLDTNIGIGQGAAARSSYVSAITAGYFRVMGIQAIAGRLPQPHELNAGVPVVVVAETWARSRYGTLEDAIGRAVTIAGVKYSLIGVIGRQFVGVGPVVVDAWIPLPCLASVTIGPRWRLLGGSYLRTYVRRLPYVTRAQLQSQVNSALAPYGKRAALEPLTRWSRFENRRETASTQWVAILSILALLVAVVGSAAIEFTATLDHARELDICEALGASQGRVLRQVIAHIALLGLLVIASAASLVAGPLPALMRWLIGTIDGPVKATTAPTVIYLAVLMSVIAGVTASLVVVWRTRNRSRSSVLSSVGPNAFRSTWSATLLGAQAATLGILTCVTVLFFRSLGVASARFALDGVGASSMVATIDAAPARERAAFFNEVAHAARDTLQIDSVALASHIPFVNNPGVSVHVDGDGRPVSLRGGGPYIAGVEPDYIDLVGLVLRQGRKFNQHDTERSSLVAIVDEQIAHALFHDRALGRCLRLGDETEPCRVIVGVVSHVNRFLNDAPFDYVYVPWSQRTDWMEPQAVLLGARSRAPLSVSALQRALQRVDPRMPFIKFATLDQPVREQLAPWIAGTRAASSFAALIAVVIAVSSFALVTFVLRVQERDWAVRVALGAAGTDIIRSACDPIRRMLVWIPGIIVIGGYWAGKAMQTLLFGVYWWDPAAILTANIASVIVLGIGVTTAVWIFSRRDFVSLLRLHPF